MPAATYDDELEATLERWRAQCDELEAELTGDFAGRGSEKAALEQAARLKKLQSGVKSIITIAKNRRAAAVKEKAATRLMQDLAEVIRRFEALQREIDKRLMAR